MKHIERNMLGRVWNIFICFVWYDLQLEKSRLWWDVSYEEGKKGKVGEM